MIPGSVSTTGGSIREKGGARSLIGSERDSFLEKTEERRLIRHERMKIPKRE